MGKRCRLWENLLTDDFEDLPEWEPRWWMWILMLLIGLSPWIGLAFAHYYYFGEF